MPRVQQTQVSGSSSSTTKVTGVRVGTPVRRIAAVPQADVENISGIDVSAGKENGATLVYNEDTGNFEASKELEETNLNGGQY